MWWKDSCPPYVLLNIITCVMAMTQKNSEGYNTKVSTFSHLLLSTFPSHHQQLDIHTVSIVNDLAACSLCSFHRQLSARAAAWLSRGNEATYWGCFETELHRCIFDRRNALFCDLCGCPSRPETIRERNESPGKRIYRSRITLISQSRHGAW